MNDDRLRRLPGPSSGTLATCKISQRGASNIGWFGFFLRLTLYGTVILVFATLSFGSQKYRLGDACVVEGFWATFEEALLGQRFWRAQHALLVHHIAALGEIDFAAVAMDESVKQEQEGLKKMLDEISEEIYATNPSLRPTPAQEKANALREQAEAIEQAEHLRILETKRLAELAKWKACREVVAGKIRQ